MLRLLQGESQLDVRQFLTEDVLQEIDTFREKSKKVKGESKDGIPNVVELPALKRMMTHYVPPAILKALFSGPTGELLLKALLQQYIIEHYRNNRGYLQRVHENTGAAPVSYDQFETEVFYHRDKMFFTDFLTSYKPVAGTAFKVDIPSLVKKQNLLKQSAEQLRVYCERMEAEGEVSSASYRERTQRLEKVEEKLATIEQDIRKAKLNQGIGNEQIIDDIPQYLCPDCGSSLWTGIAGNGAGDAMPHYHRVRNSPEAPERDNQNVCQQYLGNPIFSQEQYKDVIAARHFKNDPERLAQMRKYVVEQVIAEFGEGLSPEETEQRIQQGLDNLAVRSTKEYTGELVKDPYFIRFTASSPEDLPVPEEYIAGSLGIEVEEIAYPIKYWQEICGYPVNLASPSSPIRKQLKQVTQSYYTQGQRASKTPQSTARLQVRCPCPEATPVILAEEVPNSLAKAKQLEYLEIAVAQSMKQLEQTVKAYYPDDPTQVQEILKANQGTIACGRSHKLCQVGTVQGCEGCWPGFFKADTSSIEKVIIGGTARIESLDVAVGGEDSDDQERSRYDMISGDDIGYAQVDLTMQFQDLMAALRERLGPSFHDADSKIDIFAKYIQAHSPLLADEDEDLGLGTDGLMANLSRLMGKELHYSVCVHCGQQHDEPTLHDEFILKGGVMEQLIRDDKGKVIDVRPGQGTWGKSDKACTNVIDPSTGKRTEAHSLSAEDFKRLGIVLEQHGSFNAWKKDQEFLLRYATDVSDFFSDLNINDSEEEEDTKEESKNKLQPEDKKKKKKDEVVMPFEEAEMSEEEEDTNVLLQNVGDIFNVFESTESAEELAGQEDTGITEETETEEEEVVEEEELDTRYPISSDQISPSAEERLDTWPLTAEEIKRLEHHPDLYSKYFGLEFEYHPPRCGTERSSRPECKEHGEFEVTMYINQPASKAITVVRKAIEKDPELLEGLRDLFEGLAHASERSAGSSLELVTKRNHFDSRHNGHVFHTF